MYTEASKRATMKYTAKTYDRVELKVKKGEKEQIAEFAKSKGMSLNAYINNLIERDMKNDV